MLLFLTEPVQYLPTAVLGAVIVNAGIGLIDPAAWRALAQIDRVEVAIAGLTAGCVVVFGVLEALVVAVGLSIVDAVRRSARPYDAVLGDVPSVGRCVTLVVARLRTRMRDEFEAAGLTERIGVDRFFSSVGQAVTACSGAPPTAVPALP